MVYNIFSVNTVARAEFVPEISAASAVVLYADGSCVLEKNADERRLIASTTKLMTALVAIEQSEPDALIENGGFPCIIHWESMSRPTAVPTR